MNVHPLVEFLAREPGLAERLLALHVDDGTGRCVACPIGGQSGRRHWPCLISRYARERPALR